MSKAAEFWAGTGGNAYMKRNAPSWAEISRRAISLSRAVAAMYPLPKTVLEVGCGPGANLVALDSVLIGSRYSAIEPNAQAREAVIGRCPEVAVRAGTASEIPFEDNCFDLVMTAGVLIHISPEQLEQSMREIVRVSSRYVLAIEYFAPSVEPIMYNGDYLIWRNDFGKLYLDMGLSLVDCGFFWKHGNSGFDSTVWWLLEKSLC